MNKGQRLLKLHDAVIESAFQRVVALPPDLDTKTGWYQPRVLRVSTALEI